MSTAVQVLALALENKYLRTHVFLLLESSLALSSTIVLLTIRWVLIADQEQNPRCFSGPSRSSASWQLGLPGEYLLSHSTTSFPLPTKPSCHATRCKALQCASDILLIASLYARHKQLLLLSLLHKRLAHLIVVHLQVHLSFFHFEHFSYR